QQSTEARDRERVQSFLAREDVRRQMEALGVDPKEAAARVAGLSGKELQRIVNRLDELPAGQGSVVGPIVGAVVLIFVILLITDLLCLTSVFPFTRCAR
ncbi:MAG: PA2779 family protein, partial [Gammaproteobacteria bacterium]|nr:PA2779 family protein [Gammaproteobacteria bacterium]NIR84310.1 PA2779 family protein [Gammaproteobacteria bacterium]NIR89825.1 PA2779 family protein [Gammaproteobacteria bacterium]NIU05692.1 PA2779 family protein [Gammaproteobacteria bacterium]NIV52452.1 PA2779 family protein [Gammaproteobacteria bacterium]